MPRASAELSLLCAEKIMKNHDIGAAGERLAAEYLVSKGYTILHRNYRIGHLETDIICENETHILFAEVKSHLETGAPSRFGRPAAAVDNRKKERITAFAKEYIYQNKPSKKPRIDVIEVYLCRKNGIYILADRGIRHIENALI